MIHLLSSLPTSFLPSDPRLLLLVGAGVLGGSAPPVISGTAYPDNTLTSTKAAQWYLDGVAVSGQAGNSILVPRTVTPGQLYSQTGSNTIAVSAYDAAAATDIAAVITAGSDWGDTADRRAQYKWAYSELIRDMKAASVYTPTEFRLALMGPNSLAGALACGIGGTLTNNGPFVSGDHAQKTGLKGDGSTKYLRSSRAGNANGQDNFSWWVYVTAPMTAAASNKAFFGNMNTAGGVRMLKPSSGNTYSVRAKSTGTVVPTGDPTTATGLVGMSRSASGDFVFRANGANQTVTSASAGNLADVVDFFAQAGALLGDQRIGALGGGASVDLAALETCLNSYSTKLSAIA